MRGFTMIEAIMVIVITGIIGSMVAVFIKTSIDSYVSAERRAELTEAADIALRRMAREVRLALPNSLRIKDSAGNTGACVSPNTCFIEFIPTSNGGRYRDVGDGSTGGNVLDFVTSTNKTFDVLGVAPTLAAGASGDYIVVYNLGPNYAPADAYQLSNCAAAPGCNIAQVSSVAGNAVTLASNPFAAQSPPLPSPNNRFQVVPYATRAVTYACPTSTAGAITRYWAYGINAAQGTSAPGGSSATVVSNATCTIDYQQAAQQRSGILFVQLNISDAASGETVSVFQQIHVDNSP
jgi:MSHA biogenesis protein MshO